MRRFQHHLGVRRSEVHPYASHAAWMGDDRRQGSGQFCYRALEALAYPVSGTGIASGGIFQ